MKKVFWLILAILFISVCAYATNVTFTDGTGIDSTDNGSTLTVSVESGSIGATQIAPTTVTAGTYQAGDLTVDADGRLTYAARGQLTSLSDVSSSTKTAGRILVADGTNFTSVGVSGDCTLSSAGAVTCTELNATTGTSVSTTDAGSGFIRLTGASATTTFDININQISGPRITTSPSSFASVQGFAVDGHIAVGATTTLIASTAGISVTDTITAGSGTSASGVNTQIINDSTGIVEGGSFRGTKSSTGAGTNYATGVKGDARVTHTSGTVAEIQGVRGIGTINGSGGTTTTYYGVKGEKATVTAGTLTNNYALGATGKSIIDGSADENQLIVQAHSTQSGDIFRVENSSASPLFEVSGAGAVTGSSDITSTDTGDLGWSIQTGANTACTTTCTNAAVFGWDGTTPVGPSDASADTCVCAGSN